MNTATRPLVDVVLPAYNGARVIREALDSALAQEGVPCRIIVVDDGSTDDTAQVIRSYGPRITLRSQVNMGVSGARNTGLGMGEAPYVALLDQDDVWLPEKLGRQVDLLEAHGNAGLAFTDMTLFRDGGEIVEDGFLRATPAYSSLERRAIGSGAYLLSEGAADAVTRYNFISPSTVVLRRRAIEAVGGFDTKLRLCDDAECWMRLLRTWRAIAIEETLVRSLVWAENASLKTDGMLWERILIADKVIANPGLYSKRRGIVSRSRAGSMPVPTWNARPAEGRSGRCQEALACKLSGTVLAGRRRSYWWRRFSDRRRGHS